MLARYKLVTPTGMLVEEDIKPVSRKLYSVANEGPGLMTPELQTLMLI